MRIICLTLLLIIGLPLVTTSQAETKADSAEMLYEYLKMERDLALFFAQSQPQSFWQDQFKRSQRKLTYARSVFRDQKLPRFPDYEIGMFKHDAVRRSYQHYLQLAEHSSPQEIQVRLLWYILDQIEKNNLGRHLSTVACMARNDLRLAMASGSPDAHKVPSSLVKELVNSESEQCLQNFSPAGQDANMLGKPEPTNTFSIPKIVELY